MPKAQHSTASGVPDHLLGDRITGVTQGLASPPFPPPPTDQNPPAYGGVRLPLDPLLEAAGAYWNDRRQLVRRWRIHDGPPLRQADGSWVQPFRTRERHVAPPGMSLEDARDRGLDFYDPQYGWIRAGVKRETEAPENMGTGRFSGHVDFEPVEAPPTPGDAPGSV